MDTNEFEYYKVRRENNDNYPLLRADENVDYEYEKNHIDNAEMMEYVIRRPIPKKPIFVDYHKSPRSVISRKIYEILKDLNLDYIQFIPATITVKNNETIDDYWYLHIFNHLKVMDLEKSVYDWMETIKSANPIEKLVLNEKLLSEIPLEKRLIFKLEENHTFEIFHKSVVDAIMAANPEGIQFTKVEDYHI